MSALAQAHQRLDWKLLDRAAFGLIYGAIMVLSLLMAAGKNTEAEVKTAGILVGSMLAIALARGFAELLARGIETGERMLTASALSAAWDNSNPILAVAVMPALLFMAAAMRWCSAVLATTLAQMFCVAILVPFGARVGWVIGRSARLSIAGDLFSGSVGSALAAMKHVLH